MFVVGHQMSLTSLVHVKHVAPNPTRKKNNLGEFYYLGTYCPLLERAYLPTYLSANL